LTRRRVLTVTYAAGNGARITIKRELLVGFAFSRVLRYG
jgi:hypothetical protein